MARTRERWGTKLGVIMAVAGSAVGLGNFLRFPVQAAKNGGGAYMIPYLAALLFIGVPLMWVEWTAGRYGGSHGHSSAPGIFQTLWKRNPVIKYVGVLGLLGPLIIYMYYVYVESWTLAYCFFSVTGTLADASAGNQLTSFLAGLQGLESNQWFSGMSTVYLFFILTFAANIAVTYFGIRGGIERVCNIALPALLIFGVLLVVRVLALDWSQFNGLGFLWNPDFSSLKSAKVWLAASGQVFFTLSLGMGVILTYASYLRETDDLAVAGLSATVTNEFAEVIIGGALVIPAAFFFFGQEGIVDIANSGTFDLGFVTMPGIFSHIPAGPFFSFLWFMMLFLAGITSSISLAQPVVGFIQDEFRLSREKAVAIFGCGSFLLCQPAIWLYSKGVLFDLDFWGGSFVIVLGATVEIILVAWIFGMKNFWTELHIGSRMRVPAFFRFVIQYITPLFLLGILGAWFVQDWLDVILMKGIADADKPYIFATRIGIVLLLILFCILIRAAWNLRKREGGNEV